MVPWPLSFFLLSVTSAFSTLCLVPAAFSEEHGCLQRQLLTSKLRSSWTPPPFNFPRQLLGPWMELYGPTAECCDHCSVCPVSHTRDPWLVPLCIVLRDAILSSRPEDVVTPQRSLGGKWLVNCLFSALLSRRLEQNSIKSIPAGAFTQYKKLKRM